MKSIYAVTMVKNESDIIESFCRHALTFCDGLLVCDDDSADDTREIITKLAAEGLPITLFDNRNTIGHHQEALINYLARKAVNEHGADLVLPLDADEFLFSTDGESPRAKLERLGEPDVRKLVWPAFMPSEKTRENGVFLPLYYDEYVNQNLHTKVMAGAGVLRDPGNSISKGNHHIHSAGGVCDPPFLSGLMLAHYPVRSAEQAMSKAIVGWANSLCTPNRHHGTSEHWGRMYSQIKQNGYLNPRQLRELAMIYAFTGDPNPPAEHYVPQTDIALRYTHYEQGQRNFLNIILTNYERIISVLMERGTGYSPFESIVKA